jgi:hypothetical protein
MIVLVADYVYILHMNSILSCFIMNALRRTYYKRNIIQEYLRIWR